jgi:hypothetical protein
MGAKMEHRKVDDLPESLNCCFKAGHMKESIHPFGMDLGLSQPLNQNREL